MREERAQSRRGVSSDHHEKPRLVRAAVVHACLPKVPLSLSRERGRGEGLHKVQQVRSPTSLPKAPPLVSIVLNSPLERGALSA